jgi:hypothetical protein
MELNLPDDAMTVLRPLFLAVEGSCEVWGDDEVVRRMLIRGAMEYAKSAGRGWDDVQRIAAELRTALT